MGDGPVRYHVVKSRGGDAVVLRETRRENGALNELAIAVDDEREFLRARPLLLGRPGRRV